MCNPRTNKCLTVVTAMDFIIEGIVMLELHLRVDISWRKISDSFLIDGLKQVGHMFKMSQMEIPDNSNKGSLNTLNIYKIWIRKISIESRTLTGLASKKMIHQAQSSHSESMFIADTWRQTPSLLRMPLQLLTAEHSIPRRGK